MVAVYIMTLQCPVMSSRRTPCKRKMWRLNRGIQGTGEENSLGMGGSAAARGG